MQPFETDAELEAARRAMIESGEAQPDDLFIVWETGFDKTYLP
jgi:hypothetical protein